MWIGLLIKDQEDQDSGFLQGDGRRDARLCIEGSPDRDTRGTLVYDRVSPARWGELTPILL